MICIHTYLCVCLWSVYVHICRYVYDLYPHKFVGMVMICIRTDFSCLYPVVRKSQYIHSCIKSQSFWIDHVGRHWWVFTMCKGVAICMRVSVGQIGCADCITGAAGDKWPRQANNLRSLARYCTSAVSSLLDFSWMVLVLADTCMCA